MAIVGASERSTWSAATLSALERSGYAGRIELVNGRGGEVFGRSAVAHLSDLAEPVDLAYVIVPGEAALPVLEDAAASGVRNALVLGAGFSETGGRGAAAQEQMVRLSAEADLAIIGPNTYGFVNTECNINFQPNMLPGPLPRGHVSLVSQSGALNTNLLDYCYAHAVGVSKAVGVGNEAVVDAADLIAYLAEDDDTRAIGVFLEAIRRPAEFIAALELARARSKPVIVLKVGRHEVTARIAAAHTGAFVGDDRVIDAVLRQHAAIRVGSLEELVTTADLLAHTGPIDGSRLAVVGVSGGACDVIADRATDVGLQLQPFSESTVSALRTMQPDFGGVNNPLDVTGAIYSVSDRSLFAKVVAAVGDGAEADVVLVQHDIPNELVTFTEVFQSMLDRLPALPVPAVVAGAVTSDLPGVRERFGEGGQHIHLGGIEQVVPALGHAAWWSSRLGPAQTGMREAARPSAGAVIEEGRTGTWSEARSRALLDAFGVPMVPAVHAADTEAAVDAASATGFPVVVKANGDDLAHKSDVGAVKLVP
ncbi:MAG: acetate--CoA ligase family protein [Acidimicrobiales bacterium]